MVLLFDTSTTSPCLYPLLYSLSTLRYQIFATQQSDMIALQFWPEELLKHLARRNGTGVLQGKRFYHGNSGDIDTIKKALKYTDVSFEFAIAQPGVKTSSITLDMHNFLGSVYSTVVEMTETKLRYYFNQN